MNVKQQLHMMQKLMERVPVSYTHLDVYKRQAVVCTSPDKKRARGVASDPQ